MSLVGNGVLRHPWLAVGTQESVVDHGAHSLPLIGSGALRYLWLLWGAEATLVDHGMLRCIWLDVGHSGILGCGHS